MRNKIYYVLVCSLLLTACSKKDGSEYKEDLIQLQKLENELFAYTFKYNEQNQLTRIDVVLKNANGTMKNMSYAEFTYENRFPASANYYMIPEGKDEFLLRKKIKYVLNESNKISSIANINYRESGTETGKDTLDFFFNSKAQIIGVRLNGNGVASDSRWEINANGNLIKPNQKIAHADFTILGNYEFSYDDKRNPFHYYDLGIMVYSVFLNEIDNVEALFSMNNPISSKDNETTEYKENGQVVNTAGTNIILQRMLSYDERGIIQSSKIEYFWHMLKNGVIEMSTRQPYASVSYSCVMKQQ